MRVLPRFLVLALCCFCVIVSPAVGQDVELGGRAFLDYFYNVSGPETDAAPRATEGLHGFRYRRLYLTTDFTLAEAVTGRARLEADEGTEGRPVVKDLSLTWAYSGAHSATLGLTPPPAFRVAEGVWGYRSLEKMILDLQGVVRSRDFGLRLDGPVAGGGVVRYAVMLANNTTVQPETDTHKRVYGQLRVRPTDRLLFVVGADHAGYNDEREAGTRVSAFAGYSGERVRAGIDGYWYRVARAEGDSQISVGGSLFGILRVAPSWELVARLDRSRTARPGPDRYKTFGIGAVAYRPHPNIALIPNLRVSDPSDAVAETTARMTVEVNF